MIILDALRRPPWRVLLFAFAGILFVALIAIGGEPAWWEDAVFYEVFVRSFYDSDGDGIGDLHGLIEKLDYLNDGDPTTNDDLGVTALWLMPVCESPSYHGYDVIDYYAIEPDYGTMADFRRFLDAAHERGIRVIVDLVLNHTSNLHPWFEASRAPGSTYRDWYIWSAVSPTYLGPWGQRVWHFDGTGYYYGLFWSGMPDLNYRTSAVTEQMFDVVRFWLEDVGVDGFRLDAIRHLIEDGEEQLNTPATHHWLKGLREVSKGWSNNALLIGEVWDAPQAVVPYLDDELDLCFEFSLAEAVLKGVDQANADSIEQALRVVLAAYPEGRYATFLANHDQERAMTQVGENPERAKLAASILFTLPGTPFVYYGEEIGMTGSKPDERIRTPMQWTAEASGGFTTGTPWEPLAKDASIRTIAGQTDDETSLLSCYRQAIRLRMEHSVLRTGSTVLVETAHPSLLTYLRVLGDRVVWILHNVSDGPARPFRFDADTALLPAGSYRATSLTDDRIYTVRILEGGRLDVGAPTLLAHRSLILDLEWQAEGG